MKLGILIGALVAAVIALGVALAIVLSDDDDSDSNRTVVRTQRTVTETKTTPTTTATTQTEPTEVVRLESFVTPTQNIGCSLAGDVARCDIDERSWSPPPRPASCDVDWGQGILVDDTGKGRFVCAGDTSRDLSAPVLAYGEDSRVGDFNCASRPNGVTCENRSTGHGFLLNRERYRLF